MHRVDAAGPAGRGVVDAPAAGAGLSRVAVLAQPHRLRQLLEQDRTLVMGILNVTPDSFSDGGRFYDSVEAALRQAEQLLAQGVDLLDIGGESTRPGARAIPVDEELRRTVPVIRSLQQAFPEALLSIDTRKGAVAEAALEAGVCMVNDVSGLRFDPALASGVARHRAFLVLMHAPGTPETMQDNPTYKDVVEDVRHFLIRQSRVALDAGVLPDRILLDPGFGFGKTIEHNLTLLQQLARFGDLGFPLLVGLSRKSFLTLGNPAIAPPDREALTAAALALAIRSGAKVVRIHDAATQIPVVRLADQVVRLECKNHCENERSIGIRQKSNR